MSTAVSNAGKLKPEIRLAQALSEYCACLGECQAREFKNLRTTSPPTPQDVITLTEEINRDGSRKHRAWRPYATRTAMFLDKVQTLSCIGDFLVGSSQNLMASGVWATIKITLGIAVGSLSFFKRISELFLKVGRVSSITRDLVEVFPNSKELQDLMCEYLIVLVCFCKDVIGVLNKPTILQLSSPFIAFFEKEASKFETELTQLSTAIDRKVTVLVSQGQVESANTISRMSRTLSQWSAKSEAKKQQDLALRSSRVQDKLSSPTDQQKRIAAWRRHRKKGDVRWLFEEQGYQDWLSSDMGRVCHAKVLHINGKLGSGKTVLLANIVAELYALRAATEPPEALHRRNIITYFFCDDHYADSITPEKILGSIFQQIIASLEPNNECVREMDRLFQESDSSFPSLREQAEVLGITWPQERPVYMVIDGLDKCKNSVVEQLSALLTIIATYSTISCPHLCISSRTESPVRQLFFAGFPFLTMWKEISMTWAASKCEMKEFVEAEFVRRRDVRKLDKDLEDIIRDVLVGASEGMYLWLALQIEALFPLDGSTLLSPSDIPKVLENVPKDLAGAFNNALDRISDTRYGKTIFQLIATAKRPLTISELKIALHVKPGDTDWTSITLSLPHDERAIVGLCGGGLLEIDEEENTVRFIHHSVIQHLQQPMLSKHQSTPYHFHEYEADMHMGFICTTYLNYSIFNTALSTVNKAEVNPDQFTNKITEAVNTASLGTGAQVASRVIATITRKRNFDEPSSILRENIKVGQILQRYMQPKVETSEIMAFSSYAHEHWIWHSNRLWVKSDTDLYRPLRLLLTSTPDHVILPWDAAKDISDSGPTSPPSPPIRQPQPGRREMLRKPIMRRRSPLGLNKTVPPLPPWLRWAQVNRHFGILFENLAKAPTSAPSLEELRLYQPLLGRIFLEVYRLNVKSLDSSTDDSRQDPLCHSPGALFEEMFQAAMKLCLSRQLFAICKDITILGDFLFFNLDDNMARFTSKVYSISRTTDDLQKSLVRLLRNLGEFRGNRLVEFPDEDTSIAQLPVDTNKVNTAAENMSNIFDSFTDDSGSDYFNEE